MGHLVLQSCRIDMDCFEVVRADGTARLTPVEARLLAYLVLAADRVVSRDELLRQVWGYAPGVNSRAADFALRRLRHKVEANPKRPVHLISVYGEGYRYEGPAVGEGSSRRPLARGDWWPRPDAMRSLAAALAGQRLVTVVGPGGVGKTRLAGRACSDWGGASCDLDGCTVGAAAVARVLHALDRGESPAALLWIDHPEGVLPTLRQAIEGWLRSHPALTVLVSCRVALGLGLEARERLGPLDPQCAASFVASRTDAAGAAFDPHDPEVVDAVDRVGQIPLGLEIVAAQLAGVGRLPEGDGALLQIEHPHRDVPARHRSLASSLHATWDRLDAEARGALVRLASFDGPFEPTLGLRLLDAVPAVAERRLAELVRLGVVVGDARVELKMSPVQRCFVRQRDPEGARAADERLAAYALDAARADETVAIGMASTYRMLLRRATRDDPQRAVDLLRVVAAHPFEGDLQAYHRATDRLVDRLQAGHPRCWILLMRSQTHRMFGDNEAARADLNATWDHLQLHPDDTLRSHTLSTRILLDRTEGRFCDAVDAYLADQAWIEALPSTPERARIELAAGFACVALPERWALGAKLLRKAGARYRACGNITGQSNCDLMLGRLFLRMGRWAESEALFHSILELGRVDAFVDVWPLISLVDVAVARDDLDDARELADRAIDRVSDGSHLVERGYALAVRARVEVLAGDAAATLPWMLEIDAILLQVSHPLLQATCELSRALVAHAQGRVADVETGVGEALTHLDGAGSESKTLAYGLRALARVELGQIEDAHRDLDEVGGPTVPEALLALLRRIAGGGPVSVIQDEGLPVSRHLWAAAASTLARRRTPGEGASRQAI